MLSEGLTTGLTETIEVAMQGTTQETLDLEAEHKEKLEEIAGIKKEIADLNLNGLTGDELQEYDQLREKLADAEEEAQKLSKALGDSTNKSQQMAEVWKQVAKTIVDQLIKIATQMLVNSAIQYMLQGLGSLFGSSGGSSGATGAGLYKNLYPGGNFFKGLAQGGIFKNGINFFEKGGIIENGIALQKTTGQNTYKQLQSLLGAKLFSSGGVATGPVLGVVGEGSRNEAIVPLPDNKSIPVTFTGDSSKSDIKIMNIVDPLMVPAVLLENPDTVINIVSGDIRKRGTLYQTFKSIKE
jgi:phage-related minor tail protein